MAPVPYGVDPTRPYGSLVASASPAISGPTGQGISWLVRAERICAERVFAVGEGPGARAAADVAVSTGPAFTVKLVGRMQSAKDLGIAVDLDQRILAHIATTQRQK